MQPRTPTSCLYKFLKAKRGADPDVDPDVAGLWDPDATVMTRTWQEWDPDATVMTRTRQEWDPDATVRARTRQEGPE